MDTPEATNHLPPRLLVDFLQSDRSIAELADSFRLSFSQILAALNSPAIQAELAALQTLSTLRSELRAPRRREIALARLTDLALSSIDELEARRAATTLLRQLPPRPTTPPIAAPVATAVHAAAAVTAAPPAPAVLREASAPTRPFASPTRPNPTPPPDCQPLKFTFHPVPHLNPAPRAIATTTTRPSPQSPNATSATPTTPPTSSSPSERPAPPAPRAPRTATPIAQAPTPKPATR